MLALSARRRTLDARTSGLPAALNAMIAGSASAYDAEARTIRLIARSPMAPVARQIWARLPDLAAEGVTVTACFARLPRTRQAMDALALYADCFGREAASRNIRIADFARAQNIYEQAVVGRLAIWTGKRLGAASGALLSAGELTAIGADQESRSTASLARVLFASAWDASRPLKRASWRKLFANFAPARSARAA